MKGGQMANKRYSKGVETTKSFLRRLESAKPRKLMKGERKAFNEHKKRVLKILKESKAERKRKLLEI